MRLFVVGLLEVPFFRDGAVAYGIDTEYEADEATVVSWDNVVVVALFDQATMELLERCVAAAQRLSVRGKLACLTLVMPGVPPPPADVEDAAKAAGAYRYYACSATVLPAYGGWSMDMTQVVRRIDEASPDRCPQGTFAKVETATDWIAQVMKRDNRWQAQLTTLAGTLLYGTPSWTRPSQRADVASEPPGITDVYVEKRKRGT